MARKWPILGCRPGELHHRRNETRLFFPFKNSKTTAVLPDLAAYACLCLG